MGSLLSTLVGETEPKWQAEGKNILITGASSGIGKTLALQYAAKKANLALIARRLDALEKIAEECRALGGIANIKVHFYLSDLSKNNEIEAAVTNAAADFGRLDVVILNAGRSQGHYFEEIKDVEQIDYMLKLNTGGVINSCHYLLPYICKSSQSRIVVISSVAGIVGVPLRSVYCASKFALTGFTLVLRMELKDKYKANAPAVCLINFPEVSGTELNKTRMDFGAATPPFGFDGSNTISVDKACASLIREIAKGTREWGHPLKVSLLRPFFPLFPDFIERIVMKHVRATHVRQIE